MIRPLPALFFLTLLSAPTAAQTPAPGRSRDCEAELRSYAAGRAPAVAALEIAGALLYLPVRHTRDPLDSQLARLELELRRFRPTLVLFEGHRTEIAGDREATVREYGEAGFLRLLAAREGVSSRSLEPEPAAEIAELRRSFDAEQIQLTYLMLEAMLDRDRRGLTQSAIEKRMESLLAGNAHPALSRPLTSRQDLDTAFRRYWPPPRHWTDPPANWFDPHLSGARSGGRFTNEVVRTAAEYRDREMLRRLVAAVRAGERVLAVAGETHLAMQAAALRCALE